MPRRKIREYQAKKLLNEHIKRLGNISLNVRCVQVTPDTDFKKLASQNPWLLRERLVVKPDMLFGKRGKNNLVLLNADINEAEKFVKEKLGKKITIGGLSGEVTSFIVEPFVPHDDEYYMSIICTREENVISFSNCGGMEIEENWDKVKKVGVAVDSAIEHVNLDGLFEPNDGASITEEHRRVITSFIKACYRVFEDLNMHFLEMNPFTVLTDGASVCGVPVALDMRAELDDTASFRNGAKWMVDGAMVDFPSPFGISFTQEEQRVRDMDGQTGASLKLTVLNPNGRIWGMIAGGGASVIYADTVADLGYGHELGNYGEYSGDPKEDETYMYACSILDLATRLPPGDNRPRALMIGGAIANFTDVAATFSGIIRALREYAFALARANMKVFVRRGGPNYQIGLQKMRDLGKELGLPFEVYGPDVHMTKIVKLAIDWINGKTATGHPNGVTTMNGNGTVHMNGIH
jgi:ATP citrate (pro-S)-lyase